MQDLPVASPENDRLETFRAAVFELNYNISHIEKKYPFLGTELSSICQATISRLASPSATEITQPVVEMPCTHRIEEPVSIDHAGLHGNDIPVAAANAGNRVAYSIDAAGGFLVTGLDKMGDGIIMVFAKLLSLGARDRKQPPAIETR